MSAIKNIASGSLKSKIVKLIKFKGPLTVSDYMKIVLTNPESGFYMNNDVFGVKGHFTTNPEISQIFGEILGIWILQEWRRFNCPKPLRLVEFGPGRGTLMSDMTRALRTFEQTRGNLQLRFVEISPRLKEIQKQSISHEPDLIENSEWHPTFESLDENRSGFTAFLAHEFLDALPIHKFVRDPTTHQWRELLIDYSPEEELRYCISRNPSLSTRLLIPQGFKGDHIEVCPQAALLLDNVAKSLNKTSKGCMLVCDYGFEDEPKEIGVDSTSQVTLKPMIANRDTFRAFKDHESWPPLKEPGQADLTADVDFGYLKKQLNERATLFGSVTQRDFLVKCGLQARLNVLLENASPTEKDELVSGANMMLDDMGQRYRFLALFPKESGHLFESDPPAGFDQNHV